MDDVEGAAPLYQVTSQQEDYDRNGAGTFVQGVRVSFRTRAGANGSVFIPYADYTPAKARQLIQARAADMDEVQQLGNGG